MPAKDPTFTTRSLVLPVVGRDKEGRSTEVHTIGRAGTAIEQSYEPIPLSTIESGTGSLPKDPELIYVAKTSSAER